VYAEKSTAVTIQKIRQIILEMKPQSYSANHQRINSYAALTVHYTYSIVSIRVRSVFVKLSVRKINVFVRFKRKTSSKSSAYTFYFLCSLLWIWKHSRRVPHLQTLSHILSSWESITRANLNYQAELRDTYCRGPTLDITCLRVRDPDPYWILIRTGSWSGLDPYPDWIWIRIQSS
jgi:hypothetical protein